ncbi:MAG: hypothetical protein KF850_27240 [Labilithrix sp.]|nr:hypothetical protein [Labilithrix sp.]
MKRASFASLARVVSSLALVAAWTSPALAQTAPSPSAGAAAPSSPSGAAASDAPSTEPAGEGPSSPASETPATRGADTEVSSERGATSTVIYANPSAPPSADRAAPSGAPRYDLIRVNMGVRVGYVPSRGFDTFSSNDVLPQFSIDGTYPLFTSGKLVLGAGLGWDVGGRAGTVRGFDASLATHRLYVPLEGRWHWSPGLSVFGKIAPGAVAAIASVQDPSSPNELSTTGWAFSADASVGASILLGPRQHPEKRTIRFWLTPEIGYAVTTNAPLRGNPGRADEDLLGSDESTNLRSLALSGLFWRASVGTTF